MIRYLSAAILWFGGFGLLAAEDEGLLLHYLFEWGDETVVQDRSGGNRHGQIHGAVREASEDGYVLKFDGKNDHLEVPDSPALSPEKFTLEVWAKPSESPAPLIARNYNLGRFSYCLRIASSGNKLYAVILDKNSQTEYDLSAPAELEVWSHFALTYDRDWLRIYVNGEQKEYRPIKAADGGESAIPYTARPVNIGRSFYLDTWTYFTGTIAEVRMYDRALGAAAIKKHYAQGNPAVPAIRTGEAVQEDPSQLSLVKNGIAGATIVIPENADYWTTIAARWLREYIYKVTDTELQLRTDAAKPSGTVISVGHTKLAAAAGVDAGGLKWDGGKMIVKDRTLFLIGRDQKKLLQNPNRAARGTCRAVLTFLERYCGVRWFLPGPDGERVPKLANIAVPIDLSTTVTPAFAYSDGRFPYHRGFLSLSGETPGAIANNYRLGIAANTGGHTWYAMVPTRKYFDEHPEYFALIDGRRTGSGNHLCTSNPEVKKIILRHMQRQFDEGYEMLSIGQEDGYLRCECAECEKLDDYRWSPKDRPYADFLYEDQGLRATPCDRLFLLHKWVIDELQKSHPGKKVLLMAYGPTTWPSKKIENWGDNVWVELSIQEPEVIDAWKDKVAGITGYVYWFDIQLPMGMDVHATPAEASQRIRFLHENGFVGLYHFPETNWGMVGPVFYLIGKLMGDPYLDYQAVVKEYCDGVFENAGATMLEFFDLLYAGRSEILSLEERRPIKHPKGMTTADIYINHYPAEKLAQLEQLLQQAEKEADSDRARGWLRLTRDHFDFTTLVTKMVTAHRVFQKDGNPENWRELKRRVDLFDDFREKIISYEKAYTNRWFPGYDHFCNWMTGDAKHESTVYYKPWELRKPKVLKKGIRGMAIGYGGGFGYSFIKEPLTLDFSKVQD